MAAMTQPSPSEYCDSCSASQTPKTIASRPPTGHRMPATGTRRIAMAAWRSVRSASAIARKRPAAVTIANAEVTCRKRSVEYPTAGYRTRRRRRSGTGVRPPQRCGRRPRPAALRRPALGSVERPVCGGDGGVDRRGAGRGVQRHADARARDRIVDRRDALGGVGARQAKELVAAETGHEPALADQPAQLLAGADDRPVAGIVAVAVVDRLQPVDVTGHHREGGHGLAAPAHLLEEGAAVGEA